VESRQQVDTQASGCKEDHGDGLYRVCPSLSLCNVSKLCRLWALWIKHGRTDGSLHLGTQRLSESCSTLWTQGFIYFHRKMTCFNAFFFWYKFAVRNRLQEPWISAVIPLFFTRVIHLILHCLLTA